MNRKLFWIAFWATLALMFLLGSCTTERKVVRYVEKHPAILDLYISTDTLVLYERDTIYQDTTIIVYTPSDTVYEEIPVEVPSGISSDTIRGETEFALAEAYISEGSLRLKLIQKENRLEIQLDSVLIEYRNLEKLYSEKILRPPPEIKKVRPWWALPSLIISIFSTFLLLATLLFRK